MPDENLLADIARTFGWDPSLFLAYTASPEADTRYNASIQAVHQRGLFGVLTVMIGDEMCWGNDRLDFLEEVLHAKTAQERYA